MSTRFPLIDAEWAMRGYPTHTIASPKPYNVIPEEVCA
jgi:hypothetical protein